jgi:hypothetical protein
LGCNATFRKSGAKYSAKILKKVAQNIVPVLEKVAQKYSARLMLFPF